VWLITGSGISGCRFFFTPKKIYGASEAVGTTRYSVGYALVMKRKQKE
jgi:hypothetical protein